MFLKKIHIENYRNFHNTDIELEEGLNVVVGANNTGKTNFLRVISFLRNIPSFTIDDFNKNNLHENFEDYKTTPPIIKIKYEIEHTIDFNKADSAFEKLEKFLQYEEDGNISEENNAATLFATIELRFELDSQLLNDYKTAMTDIIEFDKFYNAFKGFISDYRFGYFNLENEMQIDNKFAVKIFEIENINAERHTAEIEEVSKSFVRNKIEEIDSDGLIKDINKGIKDKFKDITEEINIQIETDQDTIGITNGRNKFISSFEFDGDFSNYFHYEIIDDSLRYSLPVKQNGLGYNNLIYIMNKIKQKKDNDYNILLIEEPEAHLHPNMQYKLIKYIEKLKKDDERNIQNQIIITTHSPNISASTKFNNMILFNYEKKNAEVENIRAIRFGNNFEYDKVKDILDLTQKDIEEEVAFNKVIEKTKSNFIHYRKHLEKFLDITRSDLLFSSKVILVEGLAEKLTMQLWAKLLKIDLTDEHIAVIEVGGINFNNFFPVFLGQPKKAVCFRDCDFKYVKINDDNKEELNDLDNYSTFVNEQKQKFISREFQKEDFFKMFTQEKKGSTFETELFIENFEDDKNYNYLMKLAVPDCLADFISTKTIQKFHDDIEAITNGNTKNKVKKVLDLFWNKYEEKQDNEEKKMIEKIFFTYLFYDYIKNIKGEFALTLAVDENIKIKPSTQAEEKESDIYLNVPTYIKGGLEWLLK